MPTSELSNSAQDYLKLIWQATEWSDEPVTVKLLSEKLGFRASTISEALKKLGEQGYLIHRPYGSIELSELGTTHAIAMVRRHRLIETFLVQTLGYSWDEVHDEAEILEHAVSDLMIDRIDAHLGFPSRDPHGDPIPTAEGVFRDSRAVLLTELSVGQSGQISRISDESPEMLRYFAEIGVVVDQQLTVLESRPYADTLVVELDRGGEQVSLSGVAANSIWITTH